MDKFKNKISLFSFLYTLSIVYFSEYSFAAIGGKELETSQENTAILLKFFSFDMLLNVLFAGFAVLGTVVLSKFITSKLSKKIEDSYQGEDSGRIELIQVLSRTINISILTIGAAVTLTILGVDMGIFLGGFGFGIGFTLKIFLTNFISGILMVTQGFYHLGDTIKIGERIGKIRKIHALFTEVEQFDGIIYYIPNVKFLEEDVSNYHTNDKRRIDVNVKVDYDVDIMKAKKVMMQVVTNFPNILQSPETDVIVSELSDSSIDLTLRFWVSSKDSYFVSKSNVTETVNAAFKKSGIKIALPQIVVNSKNDYMSSIKNS